jgi:PAS domain S-box-containing protein
MHTNKNYTMRSHIPTSAFIPVSISLTDQQYNSMLNSLSVPILYLTPDFIIQYCNKAFEKWSDLETPFIINKRATQFFTKNFVEYIKQAIHEGSSTVESEVYIQNELKYVELSVNANTDVVNKIMGYTLVIHDISARKKSEIQLKKINLENGDKYQQVLQALPSAVYTCNKEGIITFYNKAAADLWGREPMLGKDRWCGSWNIYKTDGSPLPLDECPMAITLREGIPVCGQKIIVEQPDGKRRYILPHPKPLFSSDGLLDGAVNLLIDITEEQNSINALVESEARFRTIADNAPVVIWLADEHGDLLYLNPKWTELSGKTTEEGFGKGWANNFLPDEKEHLYSIWMSAVQKQERFNKKCHYLGANQEILIVNITGIPRYNAHGAFQGYIGILQDISASEQTNSFLESEVLKKTQILLQKNEELRKSEERYHHMIAEIQDYAIILLDKDGNIQNWNKGAESIKGYRAEEIVGKNFRHFYTDEDREKQLPEKLIESASREGKALHEGWRVRKDGTKFWGNIVITALHEEGGSIIGFSKVTRDLTEKKIAEDAAHQAALQLQEKNNELEKMNQELAAFAYVSSHDLQEPLRKIQTFADRIYESEQASFSERGRDFFKRIQNSAQRMQILIQDLLTYSRTTTENRKVERIDLNILIQEVKNELKEQLEEKNAIIESNNLPVLQAVPFQFHQLLSNLIGNSLKFSKPDIAPYIILKSGMVKGESVKASFEQNKNYHHISIQDNGIGFEPEYNSKIFEVFQRLHGRNEYNGTGIGLSICKKIAENHGGTITAEGEPDKGATFHIYLPE